MESQRQMLKGVLAESFVVLTHVPKQSFLVTQMVIVLHFAVEQHPFITRVLVFVSLVFLFFFFDLCFQFFDLLVNFFYMQ
jgi:hypothetical protein